MINPNSTPYKILRSAALVYLPALGTLYFTLAGVWGLPDTTQVIGTITALDTFLGVIIGITSKYGPSSVPDGHLVVDQTDPAKDKYSLEFTTPLSELPSRDTVTLKIQQAGQPSAA